MVTRKNGFAIEEKMGVAFVPLIGEKGLKSEIAGKLNAENKNPTIEIRQSNLNMEIKTGLIFHYFIILKFIRLVIFSAQIPKICINPTAD